jgi:predicted ATPase
MLLALIDRRDRIVGKNELLDLVWPGVVVEENNLPVHVSALRKLLGPGAITTIPGRGYRFTLVDEAAEPIPPIVQVSPNVGVAAIQADGGAPDEALVPVAPMPAAGRFDQPGDAEPIIGREEEVYDIVALLVEHRMVDIVGAGGMGKTRLARAVMRRLREDFVDGVWWVDLAPLTRAEQVASAIALALGVAVGTAPDAADGKSHGASNGSEFHNGSGSGQDAAAELARALGPRSRMLLVLDNCEQVAASVAQVVTTLLHGLPMLRILLTSRTPMHLAAEQVWRLEALQVPAVGASLAQARACGAFELFETRARAGDRRFAVDDAKLPLAIELCRRLEGHALSIEMAAARVPQVGLAPLLDRLDERLRMLRSHDRLQPARQQTLRATLHWSCSLLDDTQRTVLHRLAVLAGWFDLDTAQQTAADATSIDAWVVLDALSTLVDHSLVQASIAGDDESLVDSDPRSPPDRRGADGINTPRYRLAETTRLYAIEQFGQASDERD